MKTYLRLAIRMLLAAAIYGTFMAIVIVYEMVRLRQYRLSIFACLAVILMFTVYTWILFYRCRKRAKNL